MTDSFVIEQYLTKMYNIYRTGAHVPETSFYPALEHFLSDIGKNLSPKVVCVANTKNRGAGIPDFGLFSADQLRGKLHDADTKKNPFLVQNPSRGVIEAKPLCEDIKTIIKTEQVERYWKKYGIVLVTNFRAFALIGKSPAGKPLVLESFSLAETEIEFWRLAEHPHKAALKLGGLLFEYLKRVLLHNAPLTAPQDVAAILASYARDARLRIEDIELPTIISLKQALEDALGLHFKDKKGEHFFRSTLIQTLFYGVFSAWVLWARQRNIESNQTNVFANSIRETTDPYGITSYFDWKIAYSLLRVRMLRALFIQVAEIDTGAFDLIEVLNWAAAALNRVNHAEFFKSFDEGNAIQYFYEPFLQAFDPDLRKELGVWYTPDKIVRYQVERIDTVLRQEMNIADGLADPNVIILDPCCGTGTYLRAVIRRIATTLKDKGSDALFANDLKKAVMERIFGFEILPAPFVIAHLQLGLELETQGAPLSISRDSSERVGVYLTNALTGWDLPNEKPKQIAFPGFDEERDAARKVKQEKAILVILGNPPYNAFAGVSSEEENNIVEPYKKGLSSEWGIKKYNLDDLYIRFFRLAEKCIAEHGGRGIVSFISNYSYLSGPSFVVMRQSLLSSFDKFWFDCLNGDSRETGKITPDGKPDPSIFSTEYNKVGIQTGTAIGLMVRKDERSERQILFRHFWGGTKKTDLIDSLNNLESDFNNDYVISNPRVDNRLNLRPQEVSTTYRNPSVTRVYQETDGTSISQGSGSINLGLWGYDSSEIFLIFGWE